MKKYNFIWSVKLLILFSVSGFGQQAPQSTISQVSVYSSTAFMTVTVNNFNNAASANLMISYNPGIALATNVIQGIQLPGNLNFSLSIPGKIYISWYTFEGITLANGTEIFKINFQKVAYGTTAVSWNDSSGFSCEWANVNQMVLNDIPTSSFYINGSLQFKNPNAPYIFIMDKEVCQGTIVDIPIQIKNFNDIGKFYLTLHYDPTAMAYQSYFNSSGFPGMNVLNQGNGNLVITGMVTGGTGFSLNDSSSLFALIFYHSLGNNLLTWIDGGPGCSWNGAPPLYFNLNDIPQYNYYDDGALISKPFPVPAGNILGPPFGNVCEGQQGYIFVTDPISYALSYDWVFPPGYLIASGATSNVVTVNVPTGAPNGVVTVYGKNGCGSGVPSPPYPLNVMEPPFIISEPTIQGPVVELTGTAKFSVEAGGDDISYQWQELNSTWKNILDTGIYSGTTSAELYIIHPPYSLNGRHYRCVVSGFCPPNISSDGEAYIIVSPLIGMGELLTDNHLFIYPVPVDRFTVISFRDVKFREILLDLYDIKGRLISKRVLYPCDLTTPEVPFPFSVKEEGIYILRIRCKNINGNIVTDKKIQLEM